MKILAIDPGTTQSGYVKLDGLRLVDHGVIPNDDMLRVCSEWGYIMSLNPFSEYGFVVEKVECYGKVIGESTLETVFWTGRFCEVAGRDNRIGRKAIKISLCGLPQAKDKDIRQAVIDSFPPTGGGKVPQIGVKDHPGPLHGVSSHAWSALALALVYRESLASPC